MAERRVSRPAQAANGVARLRDGASPDYIFKDPEWADQADALASAIFIHGHLKTVANAVALEVCAAVKQGRSLADIASAMNGKGEDFRAACRAALDHAPRILKGKLKEPPRSSLKDVVGNESDLDLAKWTTKLLADKADWEKGRRKS